MTTLTSNPILDGPPTQMAGPAGAWTRAGIDFSTDEGTMRGRTVALICGDDALKAVRLAVAALRDSGSRVCYERRGDRWSIYAFPIFGEGFQLDVRAREASVAQRLAALLSSRPRIAPYVALVGPDGVGKSTVLRLIRERLREEAPFLAVSFHQWRPELLPPLSRLAGKGDSTRPDFKPRRTPGRFPFVRLAYYFVDYLLGSWWKLRRSEQSRLIIFDRCALDMEVDPVRFGLPSRFGINALWRAIPKPASVILLHDDARRIAERKDDLQEHEIREQLADWLRLAGLDKVNATVEVDTCPEEVADRVYQTLVDTFISAHEQDCPTGGEKGIERVERLLQEARGGSREAYYAAIPSSNSARFLVPLETTRAAAAAGMEIYNAQRPLARTAKTGLTLALRAGIVQHTSGSRLILDTGTLERRLGAALGCEVSLAISLGAGAQRERLVLQVTRPDGAIIAYAKAGLDHAARSALLHEEAVLRSLSGVAFRSGLAPSVLDAFDFGKARVLVQSAPPQPSGDGPRELSEVHLAFLVDLQRHRRCHLELYVHADAATGLRDAGCPYYAHLVEWAERELACDRFAVPGGLAHGDFTPWNMRVSGSRLFVFDWEFAREPVPAAWDLFHFAVASAVELRQALAGVIFEDIARLGKTSHMVRQYLEALDVEKSLWRPLLIWYLADALVRSVATLGTRADAKEQAMRRAWAGLLMLLRYRTERSAK